jgi:hypothetical protein
MSSTVIALAGNMGVGKDTIADELVRNHGYRRTAFARALKDLAGYVFGYDTATLWGPSALRNVPDSRAAFDGYWMDVEQLIYEREEFREMVTALFPLIPFSRPQAALLKLIRDDLSLKYEATTPRYVLQRLGTEWGRALWKDVWLHAVKSEIEDHDPDGKWVITDCRFANEAQFVHEDLAGRTVWVDASFRVNQLASNAHASEPSREALLPWAKDVVDNNGEISEVAERVRELLAAP